MHCLMISSHCCATQYLGSRGRGSRRERVRSGFERSNRAELLRTNALASFSLSGPVHDRLIVCLLIYLLLSLVNRHLPARSRSPDTGVGASQARRRLPSGI
jgi:hypothetical protein